MIRTTYTEVYKSNFDAGVYRQFIESNYGQVFAYGGSGATIARAKHHVKLLAKLTGISAAEIESSAIDAALLDE